MSVIYGILLLCNAMICCSLYLVNLRCVEKIMSIQHPLPIQNIIRMLYLLTHKIYFSVHVLFILFCIYLRILMFVSFNSNATGVTSGAGPANPPGAPEFTSGFSWCSCCSIFWFLCSVL